MTESTVRIGMHQAKTTLSELIKKLNEEDGLDVVITKSGEPVARLIRYAELQVPRRPGRLAGKLVVSDDFDATPEEIVADFYR